MGFYMGNKFPNGLILSPSDLLLEATSFNFYNVLPSDNPNLSFDWPTIDLTEIATKLSVPGIIEKGNEHDIDTFIFALLAHGTKPLPEGIDWVCLATRFSFLYARQLKSEGLRSLRMKAARANFFLRDLLDTFVIKDTIILNERHFSNKYVWDWLPWHEGEIIIDSCDNNAHYRNNLKQDWQSHFAGLPTQIDSLSDGLAVSSCYSNGWYKWIPGISIEQVTNNYPVVLVFNFQEDCFFLDRNGSLFWKKQSNPILSIPVNSVWRARFVDDKIFVSDWSEPGRLTIVDTAGWKISKIDTSPVILTNDLCKVNDTYYVVDKMQGRVFSYDNNFVLKDMRMSFGKKFGSLYDPITLRFHHGNLHILSWLTGSLTEVSLF
jgi:hypothetical protein